MVGYYIYLDTTRISILRLMYRTYVHQISISHNGKWNLSMSVTCWLLVLAEKITLQLASLPVYMQLQYDTTKTYRALKLTLTRLNKACNSIRNKKSTEISPLSRCPRSWDSAPTSRTLVMVQLWAGRETPPSLVFKSDLSALGCPQWVRNSSDENAGNGYRSWVTTRLWLCG